MKHSFNETLFSLGLPIVIVLAVVTLTNRCSAQRPGEIDHFVTRWARRIAPANSVNPATIIRYIHKHYEGSDAGQCVRGGHSIAQCTPTPLFLSTGEVDYSYSNRYTGSVGGNSAADILWWNVKYTPGDGSPSLCYVITDKTLYDIQNGERFDQYDIAISQVFPRCP